MDDVKNLVFNDDKYHVEKEAEIRIEQESFFDCLFKFVGWIADNFVVDFPLFAGQGGRTVFDFDDGLFELEKEFEILSLNLKESLSDAFAIIVGFNNFGSYLGLFSNNKGSKNLVSCSKTSPFVFHKRLAVAWIKGTLARCSSSGSLL